MLGLAAAVAAPVLIWFAANDALLPMLHDLVQYPRYLMAGYAKMIFPSLVSGLPLVVSELSTESSLALRLSYAVPAVSLGALMLALPISALDLRRPIASIREVGEALARDPARLALVLIATFGLISFRVALGRSSLPRTLAVLPAAVLLLGYAVDRLVDLWRRGAALRPLAASRTLATTSAGVARSAAQPWSVTPNTNPEHRLAVVIALIMLVPARYMVCLFLRRTFSGAAAPALRLVNSIGDRQAG